jgi:hypothetical protein
VNEPRPGATPEQRLSDARDLHNMLRFNLSDKGPGDTGRFGLGFKSVHLLTDNASLASGLLALRIAGGFLPKEWGEGAMLSIAYRRPDLGRPPTLIDMPRSSTLGAAPQDAAQCAFRNSMAWLPVCARHIRRVDLAHAEGQEVTVTARRQPIPELTGAQVVAVYGSLGEERRLGLTLNNRAEKYELLILLREGIPTRVASELPSLWNVVPLGEACGAGWIINGPFPVDTSRERIAGLSEDARNDLFHRLGDRLGQHLIALFDVWTGVAGQNLPT